MTSLIPSNDALVLVRIEKERRRRRRALDAGISAAWQPTFRGAAARLQTSAGSVSEVVLSGPAETGKTFATCWHLDTLLRTYAGSRAALVRKVRDSMNATVLNTYRAVIHRRGGVKPFGGAKPEWFDYENGARLHVVGMDKPEKVLSGELDFICLNQAEELGLHDYETLTTRATGRAGNAPFAQVFGDCNPGKPSHWLRQRPELKLWESRHEDNPRLFDDAGKITEQGERTLAVLDSLTGARFLRLRKGLWVQAEGVVYDGFDPAVHVVPPFTIPKEWPRYWSVDFGYTNPFVCQLWAADPDGRLFLYREIYHTGRLVEDHARRLLAVTADDPRPRAIVCDHDAEDRATLERHLRMVTTPAKKEISPGIQAVASRLKVAGDGKPRLFVVSGATDERDTSLADAKKPTSTQEEFEGYVWDTANGRKKGETPVDKDNHGMDALRYMVYWLDGKPAVYFRGVPK